MSRTPKPTRFDTVPPPPSKRPKLTPELYDAYPLQDQEQLVKHSFLKEFPDRSMDRECYHNFLIQCNDETGVDLNNCYVEVELKVLKANGKNLDASDVNKIQPANDFFNALFNRVDLRVNGVPIGDTILYHPQTALLHNLLEHDDDFLDNVLAYTNVFSKDYKYPVDMDVRHGSIKNSRTLRLYGKLNHNGFTTKRYLLPNCNIEIQLERNPAEFCLIRTKNVKDSYKLEVASCKLNVRQVLYYETVLDELQKELLGSIARFPFTRTRIQQFDIPTGSQNHRSFTFNLGNTPKCIYFAICDHDSLGGRSWGNNPMIFPAAQFGVNYVQFYSDSNKPILNRAYEPDFAEKNIGRTYTELLLTATGGFDTGRNIGITPYDMLRQYALFPARNMPNYRDLAIEIGFKKPTPKLLTGLVFIQDDTFFTLGEYGAVHYQ